MYNLYPVIIPPWPISLSLSGQLTKSEFLDESALFKIGADAYWGGAFTATYK